jgi:hypothetical protein
MQDDSPSMSPSNDQDKEKMLRDLHREVLDAIRDGKLDSIFDKRDTPETLAAVKELDLSGSMPVPCIPAAL